MHNENDELAFVGVKEIVVIAHHEYCGVPCEAYKCTKMFWCMYSLQNVKILNIAPSQLRKKKIV